MSNEPERAPFLHNLINFNELRGAKMIVCPSIAKNPIDLFKVYNLVKERGGYAQVCKDVKWKEISTICNFPITSTTAYSLRKQYVKHLLPYECKYDLNDADLDALIEETEIKNKGKGKGKQKSPSNNNNRNNQQQQEFQMNNYPNKQQTQLFPNYKPNQMSSKPAIYNNNQMIFNNTNSNYEPATTQ